MLAEVIAAGSGTPGGRSAAPTVPTPSSAQYEPWSVVPSWQTTVGDSQPSSLQSGGIRQDDAGRLRGARLLDLANTAAA
jgi:hypothetical protein